MGKTKTTKGKAEKKKKKWVRKVKERAFPLKKRKRKKSEINN